MEVICINDKNRPNEVPANRWIKKDETYTVVEACKMNTQGGILGFKLKEINNDDLAPYQYFRASRFAPLGDIEELEEILEKEEIL
jgi:hypothetical protein